MPNGPWGSSDDATGTPPPGASARSRSGSLGCVSLKYTVAGDEIELTAAATDGFVTLTVRDHGPGIPPDQQRLVFEKFGRVNTGGRSKPGAGLGLFIARSIAEAHGGTLELASEPGAGAAFTARLPAAR